jgi:hypothetical protein
MSIENLRPRYGPVMLRTKIVNARGMALPSVASTDHNNVSPSNHSHRPSPSARHHVHTFVKVLLLRFKRIQQHLLACFELLAECCRS